MSQLAKTGYAPTHDPLFYLVVGLFAVITTALPAMIGLAYFMPILQALALAVFVGLAVRRSEITPALLIVLVWMVIQLALIAGLTWLATERMEQAVVDGFAARGAVLEWYFSQRPFPNSLGETPWPRLVEAIGVSAGAFVSAGVVGEWFLMRAANSAGFHAGVILANTQGMTLALVFFGLFTLLRLAGLAGITVLCSEPMLTGNWSPSFYWSQRRCLIIVALGLLVSGLALESLVA